MKHSSYTIFLLASFFSATAIADVIYTAQGAFPLQPQQATQTQPKDKPMQIFSENATGGTQHTIVDSNGNLKMVEKEINPIPGQMAQAGTQPNASSQSGVSQPSEIGPNRDLSGPQNSQMQPNQQPTNNQSNQQQFNQQQSNQVQSSQMQPSQMQPAPPQPLPPPPPQPPVQGQMPNQVMSNPQQNQFQPSQTQPAQINRQQPAAQGPAR